MARQVRLFVERWQAVGLHKEVHTCQSAEALLSV